MFSPNQLPRPAGPPASSTPLRDYLGGRHPGVDPAYVVLPRALIEAMSLPWQQQLTYLLAEFHQTAGQLNWPIYRVVPSRYENLADLDEDQLAEVGALVEIDTDGELVYRERSGRRIDRPEETTVLVSCPDPLLPAPPAVTGPRPAAPAPQNTSTPPNPPPGGPQYSATPSGQVVPPLDPGPRPTPPSGPLPSAGAPAQPPSGGFPAQPGSGGFPAQPEGEQGHGRHSRPPW